MKSIGYAKAIFALARKIFTIIWHLVTNDESTKIKRGIKREKLIRERLLRLRYSRLMNAKNNQWNNRNYGKRGRREYLRKISSCTFMQN